MHIYVSAGGMPQANKGEAESRPSPPRPGGTAQATRRLRDYALRSAPAFELREEIEELRRWIARDTLMLEEGRFADAEEQRQCLEGRAFSIARLQTIANEIDNRVRARRFGYTERQGAPDASLGERFARLREQGGAEELADAIALETRQAGKRTGKRWRFTCCFHEDNDPSLVVFEDAFAHCFSCGWHGDLAKFIADRRGISNSQALVLLERGLA